MKMSAPGALSETAPECMEAHEDKWYLRGSVRPVQTPEGRDRKQKAVMTSWLR
jgi:hypothetical protein